MVVIKENIFLSSRLHLPHGVGGRGTYSYFLPNKLRKYQWSKWKLKNTAYLKFLYITDGLLIIRYRRNEWSQFVGVLIAE